MRLDKSEILEAIVKELETEVRRIQGANKEASGSATDEESRAESKWDTGGLEASYLARGYAQQFTELARQANGLRAFELPSFNGKAVALGALVRCDLDGYECFMFLLPAGGGIELEYQDMEVTVVTTDSPMGRALMNKIHGEAFRLPSGLKGTILEIL